MGNIDLSNLSMDKECLYSGLPMATCSHCRGDDDLANSDDEEDYEITATFDAKFNSVCLINEDHRIRRGDKVAFVQHADNPMIPVRGVVCASCVKILPRARR